MSTRTRISVLIYMMVQAVLFGIGVVITLLVTDDSAARAWGIVATIIGAMVIGTPLAWFLAPRLRARYVRDNVHSTPEEL